MVRPLISFMLAIFCVSLYPEAIHNLAAPADFVVDGVAMMQAKKSKPPVRRTPRRSSAGTTTMQGKTTYQILTDSELWGKDFPTVLAHLQSFDRANERKVVVFPTQVVSATPFKSRAEAQQSADRLSKAVSDLQSSPTPLFDRLIKRSQEPQARVSTELIAYFPEDKSTRVALASPAFQLLTQDLTVATVRKQLGNPERVSTELIDTGGEERPLILTLHSYAGGSIVFAEADIAPRPGLVNRVVMDVPAVMAALTREVR